MSSLYRRLLARGHERWPIYEIPSLSRDEVAHDSLNEQAHLQFFLSFDRNSRNWNHECYSTLVPRYKLVRQTKKTDGRARSSSSSSSLPAWPGAVPRTVKCNQPPSAYDHEDAPDEIVVDERQTIAFEVQQTGHHYHGDADQNENGIVRWTLDRNLAGMESRLTAVRRDWRLTGTSVRS